MKEVRISVYTVTEFQNFTKDIKSLLNKYYYSILSNIDLTLLNTLLSVLNFYQLKILNFIKLEKH